MSTLTVKNEDGTLCKSVEEQSRRWQRHFAKVLNIKSAYDETVFGSLCSRPVQKELDDLPSQDELVRAIASLQNSKAPAESGILPEMVRHGGPKFLIAFLSLVHRVWREGSVPQAWRDAELIPIPEKGDLSLCVTTGEALHSWTWSER